MEPYKFEFDNKEFYILEEEHRLWIQTPEKEKRDLGLVTSLRPDIYEAKFEAIDTSCTPLVELINKTENACYLKVSVVRTREYWHYGSLDNIWQGRQQTESKKLIILKRPGGYLYVVPRNTT